MTDQHNNNRVDLEKMVVFRTTIGDYERLKVVARARGMNVSEAIRALVDADLAQVYGTEGQDDDKQL